VFSHSGFVQDDSLGFAVVGSIVRDMFGVDTTIEEVDVDPEGGTVAVKTRDGGVGVGRPRRGVTPFEAKLLESLRGEDGLLPHYLVLKAFGRVYGNGVTETPVAAEYAIASAVMDTFRRRVPGFRLAVRDDDVASDIVGAVRVEEVSAVLMLSVNGSRIGVGPVEDLEGNVALPPKRGLMEELGVLRSPTIVVESKAYIPALRVEREIVLVRYNSSVDNVTVAKSLVAALKELGIDYLEIPTAFPLERGAMKRRVQEFAEKLTELAEKLKQADTARERAQILAELSKLISEDAGGIVFMSNTVHDIVRSAGLMPGTAAVISVAVPEEHVRTFRTVVATARDVEVLIRVVRKGIEILRENLQTALDELREKFIDVV